ncbi:MAG: hypothetical protein K8H84_07390 [Sulfuricella denitrificans]|nr:hypothetical protein [Sulfuricella denitrificans]
MPNPQIILVAILSLVAALGLGFYSGQDWSNTKHEAQRAKDLAAQQIAMEKQRAHADELSNALSIAEGRIITQTVEVIKYVPKVTTGQPCLNRATVSLLQPGTDPGLRPPTGALTPEGAAPASSDTDIAGWIATANQHYETCAVRLNALIDVETR